MKEKILSPTYPESVEEGVIANWKKLEGEMIIQDEVLAEIETDKVVIEVVAANDGVMTKIYKDEGEVVNSGEVIGEYEVGERELIKGEKSKKDETPKIENKEPLISNSVNKFAKDNDIDLSRSSQRDQKGPHEQIKKNSCRTFGKCSKGNCHAYNF